MLLSARCVSCFGSFLEMGAVRLFVGGNAGDVDGRFGWLCVVDDESSSCLEQPCAGVAAPRGTYPHLHLVEGTYRRTPAFPFMMETHAGIVTHLPKVNSSDFAD